MSTVEREEQERHANRSLHADPEGEERKEQRVRERTRMYDEQGVGIAHHQPAVATSDAETEQDENDDDAADREARDGELESADDEN